jgi:vacuolar iron transporter family protein
MDDTSSHFQGKSANRHIIERFSQGVSISSEPHGVEISGTKAALVDSFRSTSCLILLLFISTPLLQLNNTYSLRILVYWSLGWALWLGARSSWLSWSRLEKLHRLLEEERYEIEHHREQEREELKALYHLKGFEEPLLTEVVDVLMSDNDRLLKIMLEEELGLSLSTYEHPLKHGFGAATGSLICSLLLTGISYVLGYWAVLASGCLAITAASSYFAYSQNNNTLNACIWNLSLSLAFTGIAYSLFEWTKTFITRPL